jgi:hypothetical protein
MAGYRVKFITERNSRAEYTRGGQPEELLEPHLEVKAVMNCALIKYCTQYIVLLFCGFLFLFIQLQKVSCSLV